VGFYKAVAGDNGDLKGAVHEVPANFPAGAPTFSTQVNDASQGSLTVGTSSTVVTRTLGEPRNAACVEYNTDYLGNDIEHYSNVWTWEQCGKICHAHKTCNYWTWIPKGDRGDSFYCYLKSSNSGIRHSVEALSGHESCYN